MDHKLFEAVSVGEVNKDLDGLLGEDTNIIQQVTPMKDTLLHIAAGLGHSEIIRRIHERCSELLLKPNSVGDTPLHIAARSGHLHVVILLLDCAKNSFCLSSRDIEIGGGEAAVDFIRMRNSEKETLMHDAVRYGHLEIVDFLSREDPELLCIDNYEGESPLHVAVEKRELEIVKLILQQEHYSCQGPNGRTALHAAAFHNRTDIGRLLVGKKPDLIKVGDNNKRTALHFASTLGFLEFVDMLLENDVSTTYILDQEGFAPIHRAAQFGHISIIETFLQCRCPDLKSLVDGKYRNILHIAIECGQVDVVKYILKEKKLGELLNRRDQNGNTPLHQATINNYPYLVNLLVRDNRVIVSTINRKRFTALDIATLQSRESTEDTKELVLATLLYFDSPSWSVVWKKMLRCGVHQRLMSIEWYKDKVNILLVVATLVATVTFAAGFTMPGGYQSDGSQQGMPILGKHKKFEQFIWWDTMAMYFSTVAVLTLVWVHFNRHLPPTFVLLHFSQILTILALECMSLAFISGLNLTLVDNKSLSRRISRLGYMFYILGLATIVEYMSPVLYICPSYIWLRSWVNHRSKNVFGRRQGQVQNDIYMLYHYDV